MRWQLLHDYFLVLLIVVLKNICICLKIPFFVLKKREKYKVWSPGSHPRCTEGTRIEGPEGKQKSPALKEVR